MGWRRERVVGLDLGTSTTQVVVRGRGIVVDEPSFVAARLDTGAVVAVGEPARQMLGRTPGGMVVLRPIVHGVVDDPTGAELMVRALLRQAGAGRPPGPRVVVSVPGDVTDYERRAVEDVTLAAGARAVSVIDEPMAAAIGAGLPVAEEDASMVVDIGGGASEVAIISLGGVVERASVRVGGDDMDAAIIEWLRTERSLLIGERTAEQLKRSIAGLVPADGLAAQVIGRDLRSGLPAQRLVTAAQLREAIREPAEEILAAVRSALDRTPPELAADLLTRGMTVVGGGALLRGIDTWLEQATGLPARIANAPVTAVARGTGSCLDEVDVLEAAVPATARR